MIRRNLGPTVILFLTFNLSLTFSQSISGKVLDQSKQPVIGALVELVNTEMATYTNASGKYVFGEVPGGTYQMRITGEGIADYLYDFIFEGNDLIIAEILVESTSNTIDDGWDEIAIISGADLNSGDEDDQSISSVLTSGQDVFEDAASYNFWSARFRTRGYDNERSHLYINGMMMNDLDDGRVFWSAWGGLNDVMRNRSSNLSLNASSIGYGGVGGSSSIDLSPSGQRPGTRARYSIGNRSYVHRFALTHNSGELESGWSYSFSGARRMANEGYIEGTTYDNWAYFAAVEKEINDQHRVSLTIMGSPNKRGRSGGSFQEAYDLTDNVYYNPYWGYQNGEKRNSRTYNSHQPISILNHNWNINKKLNLKTAIGFQTGRYGTTGLDWYLAPDPRPDYYRKLPSWQETEEGKLAVEQFYKENPALFQIQWDKLYEINKNKTSTIENAFGQEGNDITGRLSSYVIQEQRFDNNKFSFNTQLEAIMNTSLTLTGGLNFMHEKTENFKILTDLLGGEFYIDFDEFAIRDFPGNDDIIQNDLNNPNRVIYEGDVFGYNYDITTQKTAGWGQLEYVGKKSDFHLGVELSNTNFFRRGYYKVGKFPDNSFGDSEKHSFNNVSVKGGLTFKIDGRNYLYANGTYRTKAPYSRYAYISARTRDEVVSNLKSETIYGGEAGYILRFPSIKGRVSAYYTAFKDQIESFSFYHDEERTFVNYVMNGVDKEHMGLELGLEGKITSTLTAEVAFALGRYIYDSRPLATISQDNNAEIIDTDRVVYLKNFYVPGTPQTAGTIGLNYSSPKYWFVNINANYFDRAYLDFNPDRRTAIGIELVDKEEDPELWNSILDEQRLEDHFTVDIFAGKSWRWDNNYLSVNLSVNNILNNQKFITGGFEQYRFDYAGKDINQFPPRYFYAYGINYSLNVSYSF